MTIGSRKTLIEIQLANLLKCQNIYSYFFIKIIYVVQTKRIVTKNQKNMCVCNVYVCFSFLISLDCVRDRCMSRIVIVVYFYMSSPLCIFFEGNYILFEESKPFPLLQHTFVYSCMPQQVAELAIRLVASCFCHVYRFFCRSHYIASTVSSDSITIFLHQCCSFSIFLSLSMSVFFFFFLLSQILDITI